jgi:hypothetical protein
VVKSVRSTGDFDSSAKNVRRVFDIYRRLVEGNSLIPPAMGLLFDAEGRPEVKRKELTTQSGGKLRFLKRRMFECYALDAKAVDALAANLCDGQPSMTFAEFVEQHGRGTEYIQAKHVSAIGGPLLASESWVTHVHAARLLHAFFKAAVDRDYLKTTQGAQLFRWLLDNDRSFLRPLIDELRDALVGWSCMPEASG